MNTIATLAVLFPGRECESLELLDIVKYIFIAIGFDIINYLIILLLIKLI